MVAGAARLLPPNASRLERALAAGAPRAGLDLLADAPAGLRASRPASFAPWQAAEWQLAEFAPYFADTQQLIAAGLPWLRQRGSAAAVKRALSWAGCDAALEMDGPWLQIDPGDSHVQQRLAQIVHLVRASLPAHVRFYRMYHGYDLRPLALDGSALDDSLLDDDSGVTADGVKLSFAVGSSGVAGRPGGVSRQAQTHARFGVAPYDDRLKLDAWQLDGALIDDGRFIVGQLITGVTDDTAATPPTLTAHRTMAFSQVVLDGAAAALDDINSHLGGAGTVVEQPLRLDDHRLDSHDIGRRHIVIDVFTDSGRAAQAAVWPLAPPGAATRMALYSAVLRPQRTAITWPARWDARPWRNTIPSTITFTNGD